LIPQNSLRDCFGAQRDRRSIPTGWIPTQIRLEVESMKRRIQGTLKNTIIYGLWIVLGAFAALAAYQAYGTLLYIGLLVVENPALRPPGWNTATIHGLSRFLILILGACWLLAVYYLEGYLKEDAELRHLWRRALWPALLVAALYGLSYGVAVLLK
jgi:hypothetical protein